MSADFSDQDEASAVQDSDNSAWASVPLPLPARQLSEFLADFERLFRLNPHLEIEAWRRESGPAAVTIHKLTALNQLNGCRGAVSIRVVPIEEGSGYRLEYDCGLKRATELRVEAQGRGSLLTVTEYYHPLADESDERFKQVDRSLVPWVAAIRGHLRGIARFGGVPGYRWWSERVMLGMPPRQRRLVRMIVWASVLEFVVFLFVALIFWLETGPS